MLMLFLSDFVVTIYSWKCNTKN